MRRKSKHSLDKNTQQKTKQCNITCTHKSTLAENITQLRIRKYRYYQVPVITYILNDTDTCEHTESMNSIFYFAFLQSDGIFWAVNTMNSCYIHTQCSSSALIFCMI